ncbi:hypothetical protein KTT_51130 [Tengunoibacter tsumagoiensis]|uniref:Uncharacterized protein n=1 Tax=Tengunoibacter tsumagoiensis TaxID=2014871 RepID=A0A402A7X3_9CHLR|nr:hypothetical protein KTT_51130 [Tengunoibacter tsumagoiensis]
MTFIVGLLQFLLFGSLFAVLGLCSLTFYGLLAGTIATLYEEECTLSAFPTVCDGEYFYCFWSHRRICGFGEKVTGGK